jgi:hypothetical protein
MRGTKQSQPPPGRMGKSARRIRYELDDAWGFSSGPIFGLDGQPRFRSLEKNDALLHKIVYHHDSAGKQTGDF